MDPLCDVAKKLVPEMAFLFHVKLPSMFAWSVASVV